MKSSSFSQEITTNQSDETLPDPTFFELHTKEASLKIRERGCYVTELQLYSPSLQEVFEIFYSDSILDTPKLSASHMMSPVGPYEGIGGQHGFPRWADYKQFTLNDGLNGSKRIAFQAKRSDAGLAIAKSFELNDSSLITVTSLHNPDNQAEDSSVGEHLYFFLKGGNFDGLRIDGLDLDSLLGEGSEDEIKQGKPLFWSNFSGHIKITMPEGYTISLKVDVDREHLKELGMLVWHRPGSESICFEPTIGFNPEIKGTGLHMGPYDTVELSTKVELM